MLKSSVQKLEPGEVNLKSTHWLLNIHLPRWSMSGQQIVKQDYFKYEWSLEFFENFRLESELDKKSLVRLPI